jgi:hypothetical protein
MQSETAVLPMSSDGIPRRDANAGFMSSKKKRPSVDGRTTKSKSPEYVQYSRWLVSFESILGRFRTPAASQAGELRRFNIRTRLVGYSAHQVPLTTCSGRRRDIPFEGNNTASGG